MTVLITRDSAEARIPGRVYIVAVDIGRAYSSTQDRAQATRFDRKDAEDLIDHHWRGLNPAIEEAS